MLLHFLQHFSDHLHPESSLSEQHLHIDKAFSPYTIITESKHTCFPDFVTMCRYIWALYTKCDHVDHKTETCQAAKVAYSDKFQCEFKDARECPYWEGGPPNRYPEPAGAMYEMNIPGETLKDKMARWRCTGIEEDVMCWSCRNRIQPRYKPIEK